VPPEPKLFDDSPIHPGKILRQFLEEKGWTQDELAEITGKRRQTINDIISGRSSMSPDMAVALAAAFGNTATEWMRWDTAYKLTLVQDDASEVQGKARLYELAPIRDMQKRGWIRDTKDLSTLEAELKAFFERDSLEEIPQFPVAMLRHSPLPYLSPAEKVWCFRARRLATALPIGGFDPKGLDVAEKRLRELAAYPKEVRYLPRTMAECGIRFVVLEHLPGTKIDGAAFWLDDSSPVIAVSARVDRLDNFWFTVMHEFAHIRNGDALSVDSDLLGDEASKVPVLIEDEIERRANEQAAASLIPTREIESFISRVGPLYSKQRIVQFANRVKVHPGIIVGQLHHRGEIGYSANREMLVKVRDVITETALTDGWGRSISPGIL
jgi:HTH-type transcriptional regulator / antitoxin HigA